MTTEIVSFGRARKCADHDYAAEISLTSTNVQPLIVMHTDRSVPTYVRPDGWT
jgi:hypothetical protein